MNGIRSTQQRNQLNQSGQDQGFINGRQQEGEYEEEVERIGEEGESDYQNENQEMRNLQNLNSHLNQTLNMIQQGQQLSKVVQIIHELLLQSKELLSGEKFANGLQSVVSSLNKEAVRMLNENDWNSCLIILQLCDTLTHPDNFGIFIESRALTINNFGCMHKRKGEFQTALSCFQDALNLQLSSSSTKYLGYTYLNISAILNTTEQHQEALINAKEAVAKLEDVLREIENQDSPEQREFQEELSNNLALAFYNIAVEEEHFQNYGCAIESYQNALSLAENTFGIDHYGTNKFKMALQSIKEKAGLLKKNQAFIRKSSAGTGPLFSGRLRPMSSPKKEYSDIDQKIVQKITGLKQAYQKNPLIRVRSSSRRQSGQNGQTSQRSQLQNKFGQPVKISLNDSNGFLQRVSFVKSSNSNLNKESEMSTPLNKTDIIKGSYYSEENNKSNDYVRRVPVRPFSGHKPKTGGVMMMIEKHKFNGKIQDKYIPPNRISTDSNIQSFSEGIPRQVLPVINDFSQTQGSFAEKNSTHSKREEEKVNERRNRQNSFKEQNKQVPKQIQDQKQKYQVSVNNYFSENQQQIPLKSQQQKEQKIKPSFIQEKIMGQVRDENEYEFDEEGIEWREEEIEEEEQELEQKIKQRQQEFIDLIKQKNQEKQMIEKDIHQKKKIKDDLQVTIKKLQEKQRIEDVIVQEKLQLQQNIQKQIKQEEENWKKKLLMMKEEEERSKINRQRQEEEALAKKRQIEEELASQQIKLKEEEEEQNKKMNEFKNSKEKQGVTSKKLIQKLNKRFLQKENLLILQEFQIDSIQIPIVAKQQLQQKGLLSVAFDIDMSSMVLMFVGEGEDQKQQQLQHQIDFCEIEGEVTEWKQEELKTLFDKYIREKLWVKISSRLLGIQKIEIINAKLNGASMVLQFSSMKNNRRSQIQQIKRIELERDLEIELKNQEGYQQTVKVDLFLEQKEDCTTKELVVELWEGLDYQGNVKFESVSSSDNQDEGLTKKNAKLQFQEIKDCIYIGENGLYYQTPEIYKKEQLEEEESANNVSPHFEEIKELTSGNLIKENQEKEKEKIKQQFSSEESSIPQNEKQVISTQLNNANNSNELICEDFEVLQEDTQQKKEQDQQKENFEEISNSHDGITLGQPKALKQGQDVNDKSVDENKEKEETLKLSENQISTLQEQQKEDGQEFKQIVNENLNDQSKDQSFIEKEEEEYLSDLDEDNNPQPVQQQRIEQQHVSQDFEAVDFQDSYENTPNQSTFQNNSESQQQQKQEKEKEQEGVEEEEKKEAEEEDPDYCKIDNSTQERCLPQESSDKIDSEQESILLLVKSQNDSLLQLEGVEIISEFTPTTIGETKGVLGSYYFRKNQNCLIEFVDIKEKQKYTHSVDCRMVSLNQSDKKFIDDVIEQIKNQCKLNIPLALLSDNFLDIKLDKDWYYTKQEENENEIIQYFFNISYRSDGRTAVDKMKSIQKKEKKQLLASAKEEEEQKQSQNQLSEIQKDISQVPQEEDIKQLLNQIKDDRQQESIDASEKDKINSLEEASSPKELVQAPLPLSEVQYDKEHEDAAIRIQTEFKSKQEKSKRKLNFFSKIIKLKENQFLLTVERTQNQSIKASFFSMEKQPKKGCLFFQIFQDFDLNLSEFEKQYKADIKKKQFVDRKDDSARKIQKLLRSNLHKKREKSKVKKIEVIKLSSEIIICLTQENDMINIQAERIVKLEKIKVKRKNTSMTLAKAKLDEFIKEYNIISNIFEVNLLSLQISLKINQSNFSIQNDSLNLEQSQIANEVIQSQVQQQEEQSSENKVQIEKDNEEEKQIEEVSQDPISVEKVQENQEDSYVQNVLNKTNNQLKSDNLNDEKEKYKSDYEEGKEVSKHGDDEEERKQAEELNNNNITQNYDNNDFEEVKEEKQKQIDSSKENVQQQQSDNIEQTDAPIPNDNKNNKSILEESQQAPNQEKQKEKEEQSVNLEGSSRQDIVIKNAEILINDQAGQASFLRVGESWKIKVYTQVEGSLIESDIIEIKDMNLQKKQVIFKNLKSIATTNTQLNSQNNIKFIVPLSDFLNEINVAPQLSEFEQIEKSNNEEQNDKIVANAIKEHSESLPSKNRKRKEKILNKSEEQSLDQVDLPPQNQHTAENEDDNKMMNDGLEII